MKKDIISYIKCPDCGSVHISEDAVFSSDDINITHGALKCQDCMQKFPIIDGILILAPKELRDYTFEISTIKNAKNDDFYSYYKNLKLSISKDADRIENKEMDFWNEVQYVKEPQKNWFRYLSREKYLYRSIQGKDSTILELGAGFGNDLFENIEKFNGCNNYICTDLSFNALRSIKERYDNLGIDIGLTLVVCLAGVPPFKENLFDVVIALGILHHTPEMHLAIPNIYNTIKKKGKLLLMEPRERKSLLGKIFRKTFPALGLKESEHELRLDFEKLKIEITSGGKIESLHTEMSPIVPLLGLTIMRGYAGNKSLTLFMQKLDQLFMHTIGAVFPDTFGYGEGLFVIIKN